MLRTIEQSLAGSHTQQVHAIQDGSTGQHEHKMAVRRIQAMRDVYKGRPGVRAILNGPGTDVVHAQQWTGRDDCLSMDC